MSVTSLSEQPLVQDAIISSLKFPFHIPRLTFLRQGVCKRIEAQGTNSNCNLA